MLNRLQLSVSSGLHNSGRSTARFFSTSTKGLVQTTQLANGVRVVTQDTWDAHTTVGCYFNAGLREEGHNGRGSYQMLQALTAAGSTKKRKGSKALYGELEGMGASLELDFGREHSSMSLTYPSSSSSGSASAAALDVLSDLWLNVDTSDAAHFDSVKWELQNQMEVSPPLIQDTVMDRLHASTFRDYSLGYTLYNNDFSQWSPQEVSDVLKRSRTGQKTVVVWVGGDVKHDAVVAEVQKKFATIGDGAPPPVLEKPYFCGAFMNYHNDEMGGDAYWSIAWPAVPMGHSDALPFMVMSQLIGEYSKFAPKALVEGKIAHNRLSYTVSNASGDFGSAEYHKGDMYFYRDTGLFTVFGISDEKTLADHITYVQFHVNLLSHSVTDEEVERAKKELKMKLFKQIDGTLNKANTYGSQTLHLNKVLHSSELIERLNALDCEDIKRVAFNYLNNSEISVIGMGPTWGLEHHYILFTRNTMQRY